MEETWESLFKNQAKSEGHSDEFIQECLDYAQKLHSQNLPVIFDTEHLARYLEITAYQLKVYVGHASNMYKNFNLQKSGNRGKREINAPRPKLKRIQQWINVNILNRDKSLLPCCHGFMPKDLNGKRNILSNAQPHVGCKWLLNMDLKNFFPSIRSKQILAYFMELGYVDEVAKALTWLCSKNFHLPQGAPSSPMLANHIAKQMDKDIQDYCYSRGMNYTRYADDITISGTEDVDAKGLIKQIEKLIYKNGFWVNRQKTKFCPAGSMQEVTGLTINNGVHVPKKYRKEVAKELYCCKKFGVTAHMKFRSDERRKQLQSKGWPNDQIKDQGFYRQWLRGRIMYIREVEPVTGNKLLAQYNEISWVF